MTLSYDFSYLHQRKLGMNLARQVFFNLFLLFLLFLDTDQIKQPGLFRFIQL